MLRLILTALAALTAYASPAVAQSNQLPSDGPILTSLSTTDFITIMAAGGLAAHEVTRQPGVITFELRIADNPDAGVVYTALRNCDDTVVPSRCTLVQPFGFFNAVGVTLQQTNDFNANKSAIAVAILGTDNLGIIGAKSYFNGGVTKYHFLVEMALFFADIDRIISAISPGSIATVSYDASSGRALAAAELGLNLPRSLDLKINNVGVKAPPILPEALKQYLQH